MIDKLHIEEFSKIKIIPGIHFLALEKWGLSLIASKLRIGSLLLMVMNVVYLNKCVLYCSDGSFTAFVVVGAAVPASLDPSLRLSSELVTV